MISIVGYKSKNVLASMSILLLTGTLTSGCTIISGHDSIVRNDTETSTRQESNTPLSTAAKELASTPWPQPQKITLPSRMAGVVLGKSQEKTISVDPVEAYFKQLNLRVLQANNQAQNVNRFTLLQKDAAEHLLTASKVTDAVYASITSENVTNVDINVAEESISNLRTARNIYIKTLKKLENDGEDIDPADISTLKKDFLNASRQLGRATDDLADRLNDNDQRPSDSVSNFIRSR